MRQITFFEALLLKELVFQMAAIVIHHPEGKILLIGKTTIQSDEALEVLQKLEDFEFVDAITADETEESPAFYAPTDAGIDQLREFGLYPIKRSMPDILKFKP